MSWSSTPGLPPANAIPATSSNSPAFQPGMRPFQTNSGQTGYFQVPQPSPWSNQQGGSGVSSMSNPMGGMGVGMGGMSGMGGMPGMQGGMPGMSGMYGMGGMQVTGQPVIMGNGGGYPGMMMGGSQQMYQQ